MSEFGPNHFELAKNETKLLENGVEIVGEKLVNCQYEELDGVTIEPVIVDVTGGSVHTKYEAGILVNRTMFDTLPQIFYNRDEAIEAAKGRLRLFETS